MKPAANPLPIREHRGQLLDSAVDLDGGADAVEDVRLQLRGGVPHRHDLVADELEERSMVSVNGVGDCSWTSECTPPSPMRLANSSRRG